MRSKPWEDVEEVLGSFYRAIDMFQSGESEDDDFDDEDESEDFSDEDDEDESDDEGSTGQNEGDQLHDRAEGLESPRKARVEANVD